MRGLRQDVQRKISKLRTSRSADADQHGGLQASHTRDAFQSNSSIESLPSGSGSSKYKIVCLIFCVR